MEGSFGRCISSPLFTFIVGENKKEFTVHSFALADLSQPLDTLINGQMIEAKTRHVDWSHTDEDTFARLCEFAYFRNYTPPTFRLIDGKTPPTKGKAKPKQKKKQPSLKWNDISMEPAPDEYPPEPAPEEVPEHDMTPSEEAYNDLEIPYKERSVWTGQLRDAFEQSLVVPNAQTTYLNYSFTPPENTGSWEDFTPVFLEQARLYVLADKYCIDSLCQLVLSKLHQTLKSFKLYDTGLNGIIELVRFVYRNAPPNYGEKIDGMRNLVTRYVVSVLGQVGENECFRELLAEGGPFVSDFWNIIWGIEEKSSA
ncbi:unnamed protein product [Penicillium discolor]